MPPDILKNSGLVENLTNVGLTALLGPLGKQLNDTVGISDKLENVTYKPRSNKSKHSSKKPKKSRVQKFNADDDWFYRLSEGEQKRYLDKHPNSKFHKTVNTKPVEESPLPSPDDKNNKRTYPEQVQAPTEPEKPKVVSPVPEHIKKEGDPKPEKKVKVVSPKKYVRPKKKKRPKHKNVFKSRKDRKKTVSAIFASVLAKLDRDTEVMHNALKSLYLILLYSTEDNKAINKKIISKAKKDWEPDLMAFLTKYKIPKLAIQKLLQAAYNDAKFTQQMSDYLVRAGDAIRGKKTALDKDTSIPKIELQLFGNFVSYFKRNSQTALNNLDRRVSILKDTDLTSAFLSTTSSTSKPQTAQDQKDLSKQLETIVKKVTKKSGQTKLTADEAKKLRATDPELYSTYNKLRQSALSVYKNYIKKLIRSSGKDKMEYYRVLDALKKANIEHTLPDGFKGLIDENLDLYTSKGQMIKGRPAGDVVMNPAYKPDEDNAYVFTAKTPMGQAYFYTVDFKQEKQTKKFENVGNLEKNIKAIQAKWQSDLRNAPKENTRLQAAQLELMFRFAARSGTGKGATGITTLLNKHVKPNSAGGLTISYTGKKGAAQKHVLLPNKPIDRLLIKIILNKKAEGGPSDPLWTYGSKTKALPVSSTANYLKQISGDPNAKLHYVRHILGTKLARDIMKRSPLKKGVSQSAAEKWYKEAMKKVGEELVHSIGGKVTGTTAIQSYIDIGLQQQFFKDLGLRVPTWLKI